MSNLPKQALKLEGGCFCSAIRYTISIPELKDRPAAPGALPTPLAATSPQLAGTSHEASDTGGKTHTVETRFPIISMDHCHSCRRACGSIVQCWFICPVDWLDFRLLPLEGGDALSQPTISVLKPSQDLQNATFIRHYAATEHSERTFCGRCGTPLTFFYSYDRGPAWKLPPVFDVALGTLDRESFDLRAVQPDRHDWWSDGTPWVQDLLRNGDGGIVRHPTGRMNSVLEEDKALVGIESSN